MSWFSRLANVFRSDRLDQDLDDEIRFHMEARAEELARAGMAPGEAKREARRRFGNELRTREASRDTRLLPGLESIFQDIRFGLRMLRKNRAATVAALLSLSLAIGACTAAFSLINSLLLRPLPVHEPERLFFLTQPRWDNSAFEEESLGYPLLERFREAANSNAELFGISSDITLQRAAFDDAHGEVEKVHSGSVIGDAFGILGIKPAVGRLLTAADGRQSGGRQVAVLGYGFWIHRFSGSAGVLGRWFSLGERQFQIVGITQDGFTGVQPGFTTDVWIPTPMPEARTDPWELWIPIWLRLKAGASPEQVRQILQVVFTNSRRELATQLFPPNAPPDRVSSFLNGRLNLRSAANGGRSFLRYQFERPLWILTIVVALVLLIACSNVANLFVARAAARELEMALRLSIGAGRGRLIRQVLIESSVLAAGACILGLGFASVAVQSIAGRLMPAGNPPNLGFQLDWRVLGFLVFLGASTTAFFGVIPALRASAVAPMNALKAGSGKHSPTVGLLRPLLAAQTCFSFIVLFLGGLLLLSFQKLTSVDLGFTRTGVVLFNLENPDRRKDDSGRVAALQLLDYVRGFPAVQAASLSRWPLLGGPFTPVMAPGFRIPGNTAEIHAPYYLEVSPGFFETMRIPVLEGREFVAQDSEPGHPTNVIVNQAFARRYFRGENPLGKRFETIYRQNLTVPQTVIGMVRDAKYNSVREAALPVVYVPLREFMTGGGDFGGDATLEVRTAADASRLAPALREIMQRVDPGLRVTDVIMQSTWIDNELLGERLLAILSGFFALVAVLLAAVGLYGVLSYSVIQRTREIGIRMALGARRVKVVRFVMADIAFMLVIGLAAGITGGIALARFLAAILFEVKPSDFWSLALPLACLLLASALAALPAALRAARMDPMEALRYE